MKNKHIWHVPAMVLFLLIFQQAASIIGGFAADLFSYGKIDEYNIFAWISVHHIVQAIIALALIVICIKVKSLDFGFRFGNVKNRIKAYIDFYCNCIYIRPCFLFRRLFL